jgi:hypothetical protein
LHGVRIPAALSTMGAKYLPTIKDQKARLRFQQQQNLLAKTRKALPPLPAKKRKQK